jgi:UDP-N-acetyl-D-glucosamine dehydrogenase
MSNIALIGLGYVGLPLAHLFLKKNHVVYGIDYDVKRIETINKGKSYLSDFRDHDIADMIQTGNFFVGSSYQVLENADVIILCVPTPLKEDHTPDISYIEKAVEYSVPFLKPGQLIILESSTYPGTTEEVIIPAITGMGYQIGTDYFVAYSPERIDPGQKQFKLEEIPKVVGGVTPVCTEKAKDLYESIFQSVVAVSSPKVAEMSKLVENSQRLINISFMNELAMVCHELEVDVWEVIKACSTKPFGFIPYYPGPGIGGHCIPVDPLYLLWKARQNNLNLNLIETAQSINHRMPEFIIEKLEKTLGVPLEQAKILVVGITYKKDVNDIRESRAIDVMVRLMESGAKLQYFDPYIDSIHINHKDLHSIELTPQCLQESDCTLILTDHSNLPIEMIVKESKTVFDTRNATKEYRGLGHIVLL